MPVNPSAAAPAEKQSGTGLMLAALGVVYGDIGTSPLYAMRQSLLAYGEVSEAGIFGILSLITWALTLVVTIKYVLLVMRADNRGEGGLLALTALALRTATGSPRRHFMIMGAGLIGAALFYGDSIITPAISVLSAVEGLKLATPLFEPYVVPIALVLLLALFAFQSRGTERVGRLFGPVMLIWFSVLAVLGLLHIGDDPRILLAINPYYAINLLLGSPWISFAVLGAVFLSVTGAEALYADMGHFGCPPLRRAWLYFVFPALLLNYFGQGALLLANPSAIENPFYKLAPDWAIYPMVILAGAATIIASQAVISGAFSMTRQAVQLGYLPRLEIRHTSEDEIGQIYIPRINMILLVGVVLLIGLFQTSDNLGAAYGVAVSGDMIITTILAYIYMRHAVGWSRLLAIPVFGGFLMLDTVFFSANLMKIAEGGWFPILVAAGIVALMWTWWRGRQILVSLRERDALPLDGFVKGLKPDRPIRIPGTAVFLTPRLDLVPNAMLHALKHYKSLHERVVMLRVLTEDVPRVPDDERLDIREMGSGFYAITARYGFLEQPNILRTLVLCRQKGMKFELMETSFIVGRERLRFARKSSLASRWRQRLFILLHNNMLSATEFFGIPPNRAIEIGGHLEI